MAENMEGTTGAPAAEAANATEQTQTGRVEFTPEQVYATKMIAFVSPT